MNKRNRLFTGLALLLLTAVLIFSQYTFHDDPSRCAVSAEEISHAVKDNVVVLDVRTKGEFAGGHIENALLIDVTSSGFASEVSKLDKNKTYYVYCKTGIRSQRAVNYMQSNGFSDVCNVPGGIRSLVREGAKLVQ